VGCLGDVVVCDYGHGQLGLLLLSLLRRADWARGCGCHDQLVLLPLLLPQLHAVPVPPLPRSQLVGQH
jgi:hypothetical protein